MNNFLSLNGNAKNNLRKTYRQGGKRIEAVVSLDHQCWRSSGFLGPNGAGKDYDQMIAGLIRPDVGWVQNCRSQSQCDPQALRELGQCWRMWLLATDSEENLEYFRDPQGSKQSSCASAR